MSFDEIFNHVNKLETCDDPCMICYLGKKEDLHKTECGHYFHLKCIKNTTKCPYCSKKILKNIKKKLKKTKKNKEIPNCLVILQSGKRKGETCNRINCHYHKLKL